MPNDTMQPELTLLLPYYNEKGWIGRTIDSLVAQHDQRFRLLLIDNASTDGSAEEARQHALPLGDRAMHLTVTIPGKIQALAAAQVSIDTPYVAFCDADTIYPAHYVARVLQMFAEDPETVAVMAIDLYAPVDSPASRRRTQRILRKAKIRPRHCHAGAYAQAFRSSAFMAVGGYDPARWPYLMEDHEIVHLVMRFGRSRYAADHYCFPSDRRKDRSSAGWNWIERQMYRLVTPRQLDWFFYEFLAPRMAARGLLAPAQRRRDWSEIALPGAAGN